VLFIAVDLEMLASMVVLAGVDLLARKSHMLKMPDSLIHRCRFKTVSISTVSVGVSEFVWHLFLLSCPTMRARVQVVRRDTCPRS